MYYMSVIAALLIVVGEQHAHTSFTRAGLVRAHVASDVFDCTDRSPGVYAAGACVNYFYQVGRVHV
jgi:hypothetical protein